MVHQLLRGSSTPPRDLSSALCRSWKMLWVLDAVAAQPTITWKTRPTLDIMCLTCLTCCTLAWATRGKQSYEQFLPQSHTRTEHCQMLAPGTSALYTYCTHLQLLYRAKCVLFLFFFIYYIFICHQDWNFVQFCSTLCNNNQGIYPIIDPYSMGPNHSALLYT